MTRVDPRWLKRRQLLQARFESLHRVRDASQFAYMRGQEERFTETQVRDMWAAAATNSMPGTLEPRNHVYIHVPFCKSICAFCNYERLKPSNPELIKGWLKRVLRSLETLGPAVEPLTFHSLYIGGGTPVILPANVLDELLTAVFDTLTFAEGSGRHIELDPAVVSDSRLNVLQRHGFRRYSFGIQTLDADVNSTHNRGPQGKEMVDNCFDALHDRGLNRVTCDFLIGLHGTTPQQTLTDLQYVLETHKPMSIDIFALVPTASYVDKLFGGDTQAFWRHIGPFQEIVPKALPELCERFGYKLMEEGGHRYTLHRQIHDEHAAKYSYTQLVSEQQRPLNLLGLGTSARSQIFQEAAFQYRDPDENPAADGEAYYEGQLVPPETEVRTYLIHQFRDRGYVREDEFHAIFGKTLDQAVGVPLGAWKELDLATVDAERVQMPEQDGPARARTLLWLVPDPMLEYEVGRIQGIDLTHDGITTVYRDIPIGRELAPGYRFWGVREGRIVLKGTDHKIKLRLAPPLQMGKPLRIVVETPPPPDAVKSLTEAVKRLRGMATRMIGLRGREAPRYSNTGPA